MKKIINAVVLVVSASLIFHACSGSDSGKYKLQAGNYGFTMTDSTGKHLLAGDMTINKTESMKISGSYDVTKKYIDKLPGMSMSKGIFEGTYDSARGIVSLNLNPKIADANIFVTARIYRSSLAGEWIYSTMMGPKARGNFVAEKAD
jgi:hypothetical protein